MSRTTLSRRRMLASLGLATGALAGGDVLFSRPAAAQSAPLDEAPLLIVCYFGGAWDTLLSLDPRDDTVFDKPPTGGDVAIYNALDRVRAFDAVTQQGLLAEPTGILQPSGSNIGFSVAMGDDAVAPRAAGHFHLPHYYEDLCVVRGIDMGTLTHEVGRRYFLTGKFPRGVSASGSDLATVIAAGDPNLASIPNLVVGGAETYNDGLDPKAAGIKVSGYQDLAAVLQPVGEVVSSPAGIQQAVAEHLDREACLRDQMDPERLAAFRAGYEKAQSIGGGSLWSHFDFVANPPANGPIAGVYEAFDINPGFPWNDLAGPKGKAAVAAQAITNGLSQTVSVQLEGGLDTHFDNWATQHAARLRRAFDAVADLIAYLKATLDGNGKPYWDRTTLVCMSEFSRTPLLNAQMGRDHHLSNACIVAGAGIKGNQVIGASDTDTYDFTSFDFEKQQSKGGSDGSPPIRPADVHLSVLTAMGYGGAHIENQEPRLLSAMLES